MKNIFSMHKKSARLTVEMSIMVALIVVVVLSMLVMFGNSLKDMTANSNFSKNILTQEKKDVDAQWKDYARTEQLITVTAEQGITFDANNPQAWVPDTFNMMLTKAQTQNLSEGELELLAKATTALDYIELPKFQIGDKVMNKGELKTTVYTEKFGNIKVRKNDYAKETVETTVNDKKMKIEIRTVSGNNRAEILKAIFNGKFE